MRPSSKLALIAVVAAVVVTACGNDNAPTSSIEKRIKRDISDKTHISSTKVTCPRNVKAKAGATFDCNAKVDSSVIPVHVTLTNKGGTRFDFQPTKAVMLTSAIVRGVQDQIKAQAGVDATVDCGKAKVFVKDPGEIIECTAKTASDTAPVRVTVKDLQGNVTFKVGED